jgi:hypothetical protein
LRIASIYFSLRAKITNMAKTTTSAEPCKHCQRVRPLQISCLLCRNCYEDKELRAQFRLLYGQRGVGKNILKMRRGRPLGKSGVDWHAMYMPPPESATNAVPGSDQKIEVMSARVSDGKSVFHEADLTFKILIGQMKMAHSEPFNYDDD